MCVIPLSNSIIYKKFGNFVQYFLNRQPGNTKAYIMSFLFSGNTKFEVYLPVLTVDTFFRFQNSVKM